ncbi:organic anion transporter 3-like [Dermacentor albipictus]|uniref:organic anion transporter 3-like n=1 Tax=Dermacentor albipictus TaxID=60249 RepID=UPI0031FC9863
MKSKRRMRSSVTTRSGSAMQKAMSHRSFTDKAHNGSFGHVREQERRRSELTGESAVIFGNGAFQGLLVAFAQVAMFVSQTMISVQAVTATSLYYWCRPPSEYSYMSTAQWLNSGIPQGPDGSYSHCSHYERPRLPGSMPTAAEVPCKHWTYNTTSSGYTIVEEWELVCDRMWLLALARAVLMCGRVVCVPLMGLACDRYGRRPVLHASVAVLYCSCVAQCFSSTLSTYVGLGLLQSVSSSVLELTTSILLFESTPLSAREELVALAASVPIVLAPVYYKALSLLAGSWRILHLAVAAPSVLLIIVVYLTGESLDWLIATGKFEDAERAALWAAELNHEKPEVVKERLAGITAGLAVPAERPPRPGRLGFCALFSGPRRCEYFVTFGCWFTMYVGYFSLPVDQVGQQLDERTWIPLYLNMVGMSSAYFITKSFGYRGPLLVLSLLCAVAVAAQLVMTGYGLMVPLAWAFRLSYVVFHMTYVFLCIHTVEIFQTRMRSMGFSLAFMCGSLGALMGALVKYMERVLAIHLKLIPRGVTAVAIASFYMGLVLVPTDTKEESPVVPREMAFGSKRSSSHISLYEESEQRRPSVRVGETTESFQRRPRVPPV